MLGLRALLISLLDQLLTRQSLPASVSSTSSSSLKPLHQVFICAAHVFLLLLQFWRCAPEEDVLAQDISDSWKDVEGVVHNQGLSYIPEVIRIELTIGHFGIEKTREFVVRKYYGDLQSLSIPAHC